MTMSEALASKWEELGPFLRRAFWQPLHRMMAIFHILPLTAALIVFFIFATNGQLREIYLSYLENLSGSHWIAATAGFTAAAAALTLLSAVLYLAHYELSTMRIGVVYSSYSNPEARCRLRILQRVAAVILALFPWLGLVAGLFGALLYLIERYDRLKGAGVTDHDLTLMLHLQAPSPWEIAIAAVALGVSIAFFLDFYRNNRFVQWAGIFITPLTAAVLLILLINPSLGAASEAWIIVALTGAALLIVMGSCLHKMRPKIIYSLTLYPDTGVNPRRRRRRVMFIWALLPWLAIALAIAPNFAAIAVQATRGPPTGAMIPLAMAWSATGLAAAVLLDRFRESTALKWAIIASVLLLIGVAEFASLRGADTIVSMYRFIGPMGSIALELVFVISAFALLAWLSQKSGFPALGLVLLGILISALFPVPIEFTVVVLTTLSGLLAFTAFLSGLRVVAILAMVLAIPGAIALLKDLNSKPVRPNQEAGLALCQRFEAWLDQPGKKPSPGAPGNLCAQRSAPAANPTKIGMANERKYPVFIIAVEGGGIYAGAAASLLLARLQDSAPSFSSHVFAVSGVSGGAIGATIFQALDRSALENNSAAVGSIQIRGRAERAAPPTPNSAASQEPNDCSKFPPLQQEVCNVMQDDHLSPVVASIFPEVFGATIRRDKALAASFEASVRSRDVRAEQELSQPFVNHWSEFSLAPALVLNTTWVETGFRVAFAPFSLHDSGDQSLYAFADTDLPGERVSLMDAAIDSARFPLILPAYSVEMKENPKAPDLRWNFVDGGYSDNSGASTALALYRALAPIAQNSNVDLELILLTSSYSQPDLTPGHVKISGTQFRDTLAPIDAILKVREGLGNEAVARVRDFFNDENRNDHLDIVELNDQAFDLPLGWKLSPTSFNVVSWMLGAPEACNDKNVLPQTAPNALPSTSQTGDIFSLLLEELGLAEPASLATSQTNLKLQRNSNSCAMKHIKDLL
jgi:hypothetical protein